MCPERPGTRQTLDELCNAYQHDPFRWTNELMLARFVERCVGCRTPAADYLELGIGHGIVLGALADAFARLTVLEGSSKLVEEYRPLYPGVEFVVTLFERFEPRRRFSHIGMGFVLEHVDDPTAILRQFSRLLSEEGRMFIGVPSASSLHRLLGLHAGLIADLRQLSPQDVAFGHKRYLTYDDWRGIVDDAGLVVVRAEGLFLAPFSTSQLARLQLEPRVLRALVDVAAQFPQLANSLFFEIRQAA